VIEPAEIAQARGDAARAAGGLEIDQHGRAVCDQDVLAVQVAMHPTRVVERAHERADRGDERSAPRAVREGERERSAVDPLRHHHVFARCEPHVRERSRHGEADGVQLR
jgi:hypothetical protein